MKRHNKTVSCLKKWVFDNREKPLSINSVIEKSGYSRRYMESTFRKLTGETIYSYIRAVQFSDAEKKLSKTNSKISEIAATYGYRSLSQFTKTFIKIYGLSPSDYRRKARNEKSATIKIKKS